VSHSPALYQRLAAYNTWMTVKAYAAAAQLTDEDRKKDRGAFFGSIHSTLNHILFGDRAWMGRFTDATYDIKPIGEDLFDDFDELRRHHAEMTGDIERFAEGLTPEWLEETLEWTAIMDGKTRYRPCWLAVTHMFNHQTHHRGQLSTLLNQAGVDIGVTDLPFMPDLVE